MFGKKLIKFVLGSNLKREKLVIRLEDLSQIWLKYNENVRPVQPPKMEETSPNLRVGDSCDGEPDLEWVEGEPPISVKPQPAPVKTATILFYEECVAPYEEIIKAAGIKDELNRIVEYLDKYGDCPSIVTDRDDEEGMDLNVVLDILSRVTLKEHSFNVARIALKLAPQYYQDYKNLVPKVLLTALCHDLGKIPELRTSGHYSKADHPLVSASKMKSFFEGKDIFWIDRGSGSVEDAIKNHHRVTSDQFTLLIKNADTKARKLEIESRSKDLRFQEWEEWFSLNELLERVRIEINVLQINQWSAFSFGSVVYVKPDFLHSAVLKMARAKKVLDFNVMIPSQKEVVLKKVAEELRKANLLLDTVKEGYYGTFYFLSFQQGKKKYFLIPIKIEGFGSFPSELKIKQGFLDLIKDVAPA